MVSKIFALDFDGVIVDSIRECFLTAWWAYHKVEDLTAEMFTQDHREAETLFKKFRYLVGPAHEYYFLMKSICEQTENANANVVQAFLNYQNTNVEQAKEFSERFFHIRSLARSRFKEQWIALNPLYPGIAEIINNYLENNSLFITSTKDEASINCILHANDIEIPSECILGKEFSIDKRTQLREIIFKTNAAPRQVFFIDDNPEHLARVMPLDVSLFLATWGYNSPEGCSIAEKLGAELLTIPQLEKMLI